jgi:hypothetical protein
VLVKAARLRTSALEQRGVSRCTPDWDQMDPPSPDYDPALAREFPGSGARLLRGGSGWGLGTVPGIGFWAASGRVPDIGGFEGARSICGAWRRPSGQDRGSAM